MKGFIIHPTYVTRDGKAFVHLYGRLENGDSFLAINELKPYFFIRKEDLNKALKVEEFDYEATHLKNFDDEAVAKVVLSIPSDVAKLRDRLHAKNIPTYEADIRFAYRFMIDKSLQGAVNIEGKHEKGKYDAGEGADRVYTEPELKPADYFPKNLKVLSIDIETDKKGKELYCIGLYSDNLKKVIIRSNEKLRNAISVGSEQEMLLKFRELVLEQDPDILTGWNFIDFDLNILEKKFKDYKLPFTIGRNDTPCRLRLYSSFFQDSKADCAGRMVLDGIQVLKNNFVALQDYKLATAAKAFLNDSKIFEGEGRWELVEDAFRKNPQLLVDYNLKDAELVPRILDKTTALELSIQRSLLTGMPLDRVRASIASLDSVYLKELRKKGYVASSVGAEERDDQGKGGYVMSSKPGIYDYIIVCDFKSLYPSIIRTFNIDPWSYLPACKEKHGKKGYGKKPVVQVPSGACFKNQEGILPEIIQHLWDQREKARKQKNELARYAIKILMNSFYGVLANPTCRFYSREMANAITLTGQHIIKLTAKKVEEMGYEVIYGDTDSIFVYPHIDDYKQAQKIGEEIASKINGFFEKHVKEGYHRKSYMELQFDKVYKRFIMPTVRGSEVGSKKRYAGLLIDSEGKEKMDFVGLEFVRRDWTDLAKTFQLELLNRIFRKEEVADYIKQLVQEVKEGKHDDLLVYKKAIRKEIDDYTKTTPPHVKAARLLGKDRTSNIIEYVMTKEGPEPIQKLKHKIDYEHYIEKQVKPIADAVLGFYEQSFDDIIKGSSQKTLFGF
ncbi:DNA polymerase II [Candidatus Woesearchaeota archaeon]|nr:DNA polymerase II [Candidatus Woesearchaeota archaeon]